MPKVHSKGSGSSNAKEAAGFILSTLCEQRRDEIELKSPSFLPAEAAHSSSQRQSDKDQAGLNSQSKMEDLPSGSLESSGRKDRMCLLPVKTSALT